MSPPASMETIPTDVTGARAPSGKWATRDGPGDDRRRAKGEGRRLQLRPSAGRARRRGCARVPTLVTICSSPTGVQKGASRSVAGVRAGVRSVRGGVCALPPLRPARPLLLRGLCGGGPRRSRSALRRHVPALVRRSASPRRAQSAAAGPQEIGARKRPITLFRRRGSGPGSRRRDGSAAHGGARWTSRSGWA